MLSTMTIFFKTSEHIVRGMTGYAGKFHSMVSIFLHGFKEPDALRGTRSSGRQFLSEPLGGRAGPGRRVPHICGCVVNRYVPCLNEPTPISIAFLCLEKSSFLHYSHFLQGPIDGRLPPVLPLTHCDEIITST